MATHNSKMKKIPPQRYFGLTKIRKGEKICWVSKQNKNGWSLGLGLNGRNVWLRHIRFASQEEVTRVLTSRVVFINTKDLK